MIPVAAVEFTGTETTVFEICVRNRKDIDHCDRVFRWVLCRRELIYSLVGLWFRKDIPFLRLLEGSKGREVFRFVDVFHWTPPKWVEAAIYSLWPATCKPFIECSRQMVSSSYIGYLITRVISLCAAEQTATLTVTLPWSGFPNCWNPRLSRDCAGWWNSTFDHLGFWRICGNDSLLRNLISNRDCLEV